MTNLISRPAAAAASIIGLEPPLRRRMIRPHGRAAVALMVDNLEMAQETLKTKGFTMISERDLAGED